VQVTDSVHLYRVNGRSIQSSVAFAPLQRSADSPKLQVVL
jgi:hypothetical protein